VNVPEELLTPAPLRLMHVVDILAFGGMEYGVIRLVNRLDPDRFAPMICCLSFKTEEAGRRVDAHVPVFALGKAPGRDLGIIFKLAALLRRQRVDVVHSHNWRTFLYTWAAAALARVPVVIHGEHGREARDALPRRRRLLSRWLAYRVTRLATVSESISRELVEEWGVGPERITTIPNGVDLALFGEERDLSALRAELDLGAGDPVVMSIGRLRPVKDYPTLLRGFARARGKVPELKLLIVGADHGGGVPPELQRLVDELQIGGAVRFTGVRSDVPDLLALCDVYVNTSVYEGMSNTILEAMAARRPVIATAVGGSPALVRDQATGYLIPAGDDQALAARLEEVATRPDRCRAMGEAARRYVESAHSMSRMIRSYSDLYRETLARRRSRRRSSREALKRSGTRALSWSGIKRAAERLRPPELAILAYHRVLPFADAVDLPFPEMVIPRDLFEAQMAHLARHYRLLDLAEAARLLRAGELPKRAVAVTFDDGYRDNYDYAWPILKKYGVPATFFVVTGALDGQVTLWWEVVAAQVRVLSQRKAAPRDRLPGPIGEHLARLGEGAPPALVARAMVDELNGLPAVARRQALRDLAAVAGDNATMRSDLLLGWQEVRELQRSGMGIGTHTVSHAFLDEVTDAEAEAEIGGSVARLSQQLERAPRVLAYPRGRTRRGLEPLLRRAGIEAAVTTVLGCNGAGSDPYALSRLDSGYLRLDAGFDPVLFELELQGLPARLRNAAGGVRRRAAATSRRSMLAGPAHLHDQGATAGTHWLPRSGSEETAK
jgi:sugar transferase (PEP-CTERM/EpsH1 system associated)